MSRRAKRKAKRTWFFHGKHKAEATSVAVAARNAGAEKVYLESVKANIKAADKASAQPPPHVAQSKPHAEPLVMGQSIAPPRDRPDIAKLMSMLTYKRQAGSKSEAEFIAKYIDTIPGMASDTYGNRWVVVGENKAGVMFSCHTDSVHRDAGRQGIRYDGRYIALKADAQSNCLGADDGAGVFLCVELIAAGVEGLYVFHREEERGGRGSAFIAEAYSGKHSAQADHDTAKRMLDGIRCCIAFDRKGTTSVITHQSMGRTASDAFANSMSDALSLPRLKPDDTGMFTDSANYAQSCIAECTNLSVGYEHEHRNAEYLDTHWLLALRDAFITAWNPAKLVIMRKAGEWAMQGDDDYDWYLDAQADAAERMAEDKMKSMSDLVWEYPDAVVEVLKDYGIDEDVILSYAHDMQKSRY